MSAEHFECERNGADGPDQKERPTGGSPLFRAEPVRQQKTGAGAERHKPRIEEELHRFERFQVGA